ncbi:MAG: YciI family protein [Gallionella sp.]
MLYAFICHDTPNSQEKRLASRPEHLARLQTLQSQGRLTLAGPFPAIEAEDAGTYTGSLIVAEFSSLLEAQTWADADPYLVSGVYESIVVKPFKKTFPT